MALFCVVSHCAYAGKPSMNRFVGTVSLHGLIACVTVPTPLVSRPPSLQPNNNARLTNAPDQVRACAIVSGMSYDGSSNRQLKVGYRPGQCPSFSGSGSMN